MDVRACITYTHTHTQHCNLILPDQTGPMYQPPRVKNADELRLVLRDWRCLKIQMRFKSSGKKTRALGVGWGGGSKRQDGVRNIFIGPLKLSKSERRQ